jgi:hypothetical protein
MAVLGTPDRVGVGAVFQSDASQAREGFGAVTKADIQAAAAAVDAWCDANTASFNAAIPVAARTALSPTQKSRLLLYVVRRRAEVGV